MSLWLQPVAGTVLVAAVAFRAGERRLVTALELADATSPERAVKLPLTNVVTKWIFRRLLNAGAAGETMMQLQYLKVREYAEFRGRRRRRALLILPVILTLAFLFYLRSR